MGMERGKLIPSLHSSFVGTSDQARVLFPLEDCSALKEDDRMGAIERAELQSKAEEKAKALAKAKKEDEKAKEMKKTLAKEKKAFEADIEKSLKADEKAEAKLAKTGDSRKRMTERFTKEYDEEEAKIEATEKKGKDYTEAADKVQADPERLKELAKSTRVYPADTPIQPQAVKRANVMTTPFPRHSTSKATSQSASAAIPAPTDAPVEPTAPVLATRVLSMTDITAKCAAAVERHFGDDDDTFQEVYSEIVKGTQIRDEESQGIVAKHSFAVFSALRQPEIQSRSPNETRLLFEAMGMGIEGLVHGAERAFDGYRPVIRWEK